jgi:gamma-glutamyltranspeptidase/glutathione hydrolase
MTQVTIAAGSQIAAEAGATIANQGGNAVDAALAATLVSMVTDLGVMAPGASGFIAIWPVAEDPVVIDAYAEMPGRGLASAQVGQGTFVADFDYGGPMRNVVGYGSVATPGIFAGLGTASHHHGRLPWAEVVEPAIHWADQGFPLTGGAAEYLNYTHEAIFSWHPDSYRALHHSDGRLLQAGETVHIPYLADSLRLIAAGGVDVFYTGTIGQRMAAEIQANDGLLTAEDLAAYRPISRPPLRFRFGDWDITTNPAPAIGGGCLAAMLYLLDQTAANQDIDPVKTLIQIQRAVLDYRGTTLDGLVDNADAISHLLILSRQGDFQGLLKSPSTIHISAVDSNSLACSISASAGYGSGAMVTGTGLWLNNSLGEIDLHPQGIAALHPGTRLASNMAPTVARRSDGAVLAVGSPGASRITTAIAQVLANVMHRGMSLEAAIAHPRLHVETTEGVLRLAYEPGLSLPPRSATEFVLKPFAQPSMYFGGVQIARWCPITGLNAVADLRRSGGVATGQH